MTARGITDRQKKERPGNLYRVALRGQQCLGTAEEYHAKVVAADFLTAVRLTTEALRLDPACLEGVVVTLICTGSELQEGRVFDTGHRCRGYGDRGGWTPDSSQARRP